jgi:hypothetical protein
MTVIHRNEIHTPGPSQHWAICSRLDPPRVFRAHLHGGFNAILPLRVGSWNDTED